MDAKAPDEQVGHRATEEEALLVWLKWTVIEVQEHGCEDSLHLRLAHKLAKDIEV